MVIKTDMLISQETQKEHALSEITNFIAQEIYRIAVMEHYPDDYYSIQNLSNNVWDKFQSLRDQGIDNLIDNLTSEIINHIVFQRDEDNFDINIKEMIDDEGECLLALVGSPDTEIVANYDYLKHENELKKNVFQIAKELFLEHRNFSCNIPHKYPPHILSCTFDYKLALEHYHGLFFLPMEKGNTITFTSAPYFSLRPYSTKNISRFKVIIEKVEISNQALSKKLQTVIEEVDCTEPDLLESYVSLDFAKRLNPYNSINYAKKLRCELDTSNPLSEKEIDKFFSQLRAEIVSIQYKNKQCKLLMAESKEELISAYRIPELKSNDWVQIEKLHKVEMPNLETPSHAKNYLLGLILAHRDYINKKNRKLNGKGGDGLNLSDRADFLSQELAKNHGEKGFTASMINKGYKLVRKAINSHINDFKQFST